jgi:hypothetical protein
MLAMNDGRRLEGAWALALCATVCATAIGCGDGGGGSGQSADEGIGLTGLDGGATTQVSATEGEDQGEPKLDLPVTDLPTDDECAAVSSTAELVALPADIIFIVDNSGSMSFEAGEIQARMNDFSSQIIASGVDVHVVLVSSYPGNGNGICIDPPLGAGGCPQADDNPPVFTHVDERVGSHDAWARLLSTHAEWADAIREDSVKHLVVVTDDTSNMNWDQFDAQFLALHPSYAGYLHHSVVCHSNCASAAGIGTDYITLSNNTGGVAADLCDQDFQAVFDVLSTEVIGGAALACEFEIPPPPDGMEFNPNAVNLEFDDGMGGTLQIGRVDSSAECPNVVDGWYYDDPLAPAMIVMCPQTCAKIQAAVDGTINIAFGCATVAAG